MISQITNLRDKELDLLAQFMGHDIRIHYECFADWGILAKFYTIVMDNAANVMAVCDLQNRSNLPCWHTQ